MRSFPSLLNLVFGLSLRLFQMYLFFSTFIFRLSRPSMLTCTPSPYSSHFQFFFHSFISSHLHPSLTRQTTMSLFKNTFSQKLKLSSPAIHHPERKRPSPIDIPEILERIFYFTDDFTLRWTAVLVRRQWFHMNTNRFPRTVYYKNDMRRQGQQPELVVSRLTGAARLCCYLTVDEMSRGNDYVYAY